MERTRNDSSLIAWMLYACVLFNLLACGIAHGQMTGLSLNSAGGQFCSVSNDGIPDTPGDPVAPSESRWASNFNCPICASITLSLNYLFCLAWLARILAFQQKNLEHRCKAPPRYSWPSANPRASPF
jgi:hypothetical protein